MPNKAIARLGIMAAAEAAGGSAGIMGMGAVAGIATEFAVGGALEAAQASMRRGVSIGGRKVSPLLTQAYRAGEGSIKVHRIQPEDFAVKDPDRVQRALHFTAAGMLVEAEALVDVLHIVDVADNDPGLWKFLHRGKNRARSVMAGPRIADIPWRLHQEVAVDSYARCKMRGQPQHDFIQRTGWDPVEYRRLIVPLFGSRGQVNRMAVLLLTEQRSQIFGRFLTPAMGDEELGSLASEIRRDRAKGAHRPRRFIPDLFLRR